jgi:hypothetical protein
MPRHIGNPQHQPSAGDKLNDPKQDYIKRIKDHSTVMAIDRTKCSHNGNNLCSTGHNWTHASRQQQGSSSEKQSSVRKANLQYSRKQQQPAAGNQPAKLDATNQLIVQSNQRNQQPTSRD